jgi:hypothetical protein
LLIQGGFDLAVRSAQKDGAARASSPYRNFQVERPR